MTHKTGPRKTKVRALERAINDAIRHSGATVSETFRAISKVQSRRFDDMLAVQVRIVTEMLAPFEEVTCPTCHPGKPGKRTRSGGAGRKV